MDTKNPMQEYSYGTNPIYNQAYKMLAGKQDIDTIFINSTTLIRNVVNQYASEELKRVKQKEQSKSDAARKLGFIAVQEIASLLYDLAALLNRPSPVPLVIIAYSYDYKGMIPDKFKRSKNDDLLSEVIYHANNISHISQKQQATYQNVMLYTVYYEGDNIVTALEHALDSVKNQHNVLMISHHPIDYHIAPICNSWRIIKSYTGAIWTYDDLGKNVLKHNLPYLKHLHILLGDQTDLKPTLPLRDREKLIKVAQDESWYLLPEDKIEERLRQLTYLTPYTF